MTSDTVRDARYLYCIIKYGEEHSFDGLQAIGGHGNSVYTVAYEDLACVVSDSSDIKYESTRTNMIAHETVIEQIMLRGFTVLPIRFGTVTSKSSPSPEDDIRQKLLKSGSRELHELHNQMEGKIELGLKVLWRDEKTIFEEIIAENREIHRLRDSLIRRPPEATYFDRMRAGEMVKAALAVKRDKEADKLLSKIRPLTDRIKENKIIMDRMVLNAAFLVDKRQEEAFDAIVQKLDEELGERMVFRYSGPNPPFNFCEIVVSWEED